MFLKQERLIDEKGGKKKTDEHRGTLPDIFRYCISVYLFCLTGWTAG